MRKVFTLLSLVSLLLLGSSAAFAKAVVASGGGNAGGSHGVAHGAAKVRPATNVKLPPPGAVKPGGKKVSTGAPAAPVNLTIEDLEVGLGEAVQAGQTVMVHYTGTVQSTGKTFETTYSRQYPFEFTVGNGKALAGLDQGVRGMAVGGKRKLVISPKWAFGEAGKPPNVPANAVIEMTVELVSVR